MIGYIVKNDSLLTQYEYSDDPEHLMAPLEPKPLLVNFSAGKLAHIVANKQRANNLVRYANIESTNKKD